MTTAGRHAVTLGFALGLGACLGGGGDESSESSSPRADSGAEQADAASGSRDAGSPADASVAADAGVFTDAAVLPADPACAAAPASGLTTLTLTVDGRQRAYELLIPEGVQLGEQLPLVLALHGRDGHGADMRGVGIQDAAAAKNQRAIFVFPDALDYAGENARGWDIKCDSYDMHFMQALYEATRASTCIDPARVFVTGFSWGADMTIATGCCLHDLVRAIAPLSGTAWGSWRNACPNDVPDYLATIGTDDGAYSLGDVTAVTETFRARKGCEASTHTLSPAECVSYDGCGDKVRQCTYPGMGHSPPPGAASLVWDFFATR